MFYWFLKHILVGPAVRVVFRPWVEGRDNVPATGGAILASNHLSFSDSIFLPLMVDRRVTFPAKQEYFTGTGVRGWLTKQFFTAAGQIPIDRSGGQASLVALEKGLEVLRRGELFGIYPEGTRSPDGRLYRGKTGMARLAVAADVPIVPCAMIDTDKAQPTGQRIPNVVQVGVRIGRPLHYPQYAGQTENHQALREITDDVMRELQRLSGQDYVDEYASSVKKRLAARARDGIELARENIEQARERARAGLTEAADKAREGLAARRARQEGEGPSEGPVAGDSAAHDPQIPEDRGPRTPPSA